MVKIIYICVMNAVSMVVDFLDCAFVMQQQTRMLSTVQKIGTKLGQQFQFITNKRKCPGCHARG